jgi:hypothetical protein
MKSQQNVTECDNCKKYTDHDCTENRIRQHRKEGRRIRKQPTVISGECEGFVDKRNVSPEATPAPEPTPVAEATPAPEPTSEPAPDLKTEPTFGVVAFVEDVESAVEKLLSVNYSTSKVKIHIVSTPEKPERKMIALDQLKHKFNHSTLTMNLLEKELIQTESHAFGLVKEAKYFVMIEDGDELDPDFLQKVSDNESEIGIYSDRTTVAISSRLASKNYLDYADFGFMLDSFMENKDSVCYLNEK